MAGRYAYLWAELVVPAHQLKLSTPSPYTIQAVKATAGGPAPAAWHLIAVVLASDVLLHSLVSPASLSDAVNMDSLPAGYELSSISGSIGMINGRTFAERNDYNRRSWQ